MLHCNFVYRRELHLCTVGVTSCPPEHLLQADYFNIHHHSLTHSKPSTTPPTLTTFQTRLKLLAQHNNKPILQHIISLSYSTFTPILPPIFSISSSLSYSKTMPSDASKPDMSAATKDVLTKVQRMIPPMLDTFHKGMCSLSRA